MLKYFLFSALLHISFFAFFMASPNIREDANLQPEMQIQLQTEITPIIHVTPPTQALKPTESLLPPTPSPENTLMTQDAPDLQEAPVMREARGPFTRHLRRAHQNAPLLERFAVNCDSNAHRDDCRRKGEVPTQGDFP